MTLIVYIATTIEVDVQRDIVDKYDSNLTVLYLPLLIAPAVFLILTDLSFPDRQDATDPDRCNSLVLNLRSDRANVG